MENQANLNLISAAPDMMEALQMLMPQEPREADSYDRAMWDNARAAIAKATGKGDAWNSPAHDAGVVNGQILRVLACYAMTGGKNPPKPLATH
jgi:hypothetical protein